MTDPEASSTSQPAAASVARLRQLIEQAASGAMTVDEFSHVFRQTHEAIERVGRSRYSSKEEARLIWDVLWMIEFYSPDPAQESDPLEWHDAAAVLVQVRRAAEALQRL